MPKVDTLRLDLQSIKNLYAILQPEFEKQLQDVSDHEAEVIIQRRESFVVFMDGDMAGGLKRMESSENLKFDRKQSLRC